jgi:pyridoxine kinase
VSLPHQPDKTGVAILTREMQDVEFLFGTRYEGLFHGTGDVFASFMLAALMKDLSPVEAARLSLDMTHEAIRLTLEDGEPLRYGLQFERVLHRLYGLS